MSQRGFLSCTSYQVVPQKQQRGKNVCRLLEVQTQPNSASFPNLQEQQLHTYLLKFYCLNLPVLLPHLYPLLFYPFQTQRFYNSLLISHMLSIFWIVGKKCLYLLLLTMLILGCFLPPLQSRLKEYLLSPLKNLREEKLNPIIQFTGPKTIY